MHFLHIAIQYSIFNLPEISPKLHSIDRGRIFAKSSEIRYFAQKITLIKNVIEIVVYRLRLNGLAKTTNPHPSHPYLLLVAA